MNAKALVIFLVALQCATLLTQAARPLGEEASYGSERKILAYAGASSGSSAKSNDRKGSASAGVDVRAHNGKIAGTASANSESFTFAKNAIASATSIAIAQVEGGGKAVAAARAAARAVGVAIAEAKASTVIAIVSQGEHNKGCATAKASAEAEARAFAFAVADVFAKAENYKAESVVKGHVSALETAYANAVADAESGGCVRGTGYTLAKQESFAIAMTKAYATVYAEALAAVKDKYSASALNLGGSTDADEDVEVGSRSVSRVEGNADSFNFGSSSGNALAGFEWYP